MIKCPYCNNANEESLHQHDKSLAGYRDYGRFFTCFKCRKEFVVQKEEVADEEVERFSTGK